MKDMKLRIKAAGITLGILVTFGILAWLVCTHLKVALGIISIVLSLSTIVVLYWGIHLTLKGEA